MRINSSRVVVDGVYSYLEIETEDGTMTLPREQKLYGRYGLLFVGSGWEGRLPEITLPADKADGRAETVLAGFTRDRGVAALFGRFLNWDGGEWNG